jgi:hypothetical protein
MAINYLVSQSGQKSYRRLVITDFYFAICCIEKKYLEVNIK